MKFRFHLLFLLVAFSILGTACAGNNRVIASSWPGITTDGSRVFVSYANHVYGLDGATGTEDWKFPVEADNKLSFYAAPALGGDGQLIVGGYNNVLYSLDPDSGQQNSWTFTESRNKYIASPLVVEDLILASSSDNHLYALDFGGNLVWDFTTPEAQWAQPATDGRLVFLPSLDHNVYAIDIQTGEEVWKVDMGGAVVGQPVVGDGLVYIGSFAKKLVALDPATGDEVWSLPTSNWVWAGPTLVDGTLYFGDIDGDLYALDAATGESLWERKLDGGIYSSPLVHNGKLYLGTSTGSFYGLSTDNELLWTPQKLGGKIYSSPVAVENLIIVTQLENEKVVIAVDENGIERWFYPPPSEE